MRLLVVSARSPDETITGAAANQRALVAGLVRRGFACDTVSGSRTMVQAALAEQRPDAVMIWGGRDLASDVVEAAAPRGIPTVHQIRTPSTYHIAQLGWDGTARLADDERARTPARRIADLVLVPSRFMADYWTERLGVRPEVMYPIIEARRVRVRRRGARYVTFVNPEPGKGLGVFWRLAVEAAARLPRVRFLVVEGRWGAREMTRAGIALDALPNVRVVPNQPDVRRIWERTQLLLVPSLLPEGFALVVHEAHLNGIPVIASRIAGIPEAANGGAILLAPPRRCVRDWTHVATAREVAPWLDALAQLVGDRPSRTRARRRALRAATGFSPDAIVDEVAARLHTLVGRTRARA